MAKTETTVKGYVYTVTSPNGGTVTDAEGKLSKTVDAGDQVTVTAPSDALTCDDDEAVICKATFNHALAALGLLGGGADKLPAGYTRLEFLKGTGSQYIDTGISPDADTGCRIVTEPSQFLNFTLLAGAASETNGFVPLLSYSDYTIGYSVGATSAYPIQDGSIASSGKEALSSGYKAVGRIKVELNYKNSSRWNYEDELNKVSRAVTLKSFGLNIYLFARNYNNQQPGGNYFYGWGSPIYSARFTKGKNLRADFIPALDAEGTPCMYDTVTRKPFRNAGTGQFVVGMTLNQVRALRLPAGGGELTLSLPYEASVDQKAQAALEAALLNGWTLSIQYQQGELPADWHRDVSFLESTGTQFIDTGVKLSSESEVESRYIAFDDGNEKQSNYYLFASRDVYTKNAFDYMAFYRPTRLAIAYCGGDGTTQRSRNVLNTNVLNTVHTLKQNVNYIKVDEGVFSYPSAPTPFECLHDCLLGSKYETATGGYNFVGRVYTFTITRAGTPQLNLQPCIDADGIPCMWDSVSKQALYNAGSGSFIVGLESVEDVRAFLLPPCGGELTLSLPHEASIDRLAQAALERARANGWTLQLQYAEAEVPAGYRRLDFLESTGTQKLQITTNSSYIKAIVDIQYTQTALDQYQGFITSGSFFGTSADGYWLSSVNQPRIKATTDRIIIANTFDHGTIAIDYGGLTAKTGTTPYEECPQFCLFARGTNYSHCRIHSVKLSVEPDVVHVLSPCISPNGTLGMYNKVDGTLYDNDGTGQFIAGLATVDDVRKLWLPETSGELTVSVPADTPDSTVEQLRKNNPSWQIAIQYRTENNEN